MSNKAGFVVENKFVKGLVTESTALNFPQDACTDTQNCVFNEFGLVTRRPGLDLEQMYVENAITPASGVVFQEFTWYTSASNSNQAYLVQQIGSTLYFFDITTSTVTSSTLASITIDLTTYLPSGSGQDPSVVPCQFAIGNGDLLVSNQVLNPFYVTFNENTNSIEAHIITLKYRDTAGVDDGLAVDTRPTETVTSLQTNNPAHYYNLLNQGWGTASALSQWDADNTTMPSNADAIAYYRQDSSDSYRTGSADSVNPGNSPAPKGHFILNVGEDDRTAAVGFTVPGQNSSSLISRTLGTPIGPGSNKSFAFDGDEDESQSGNWTDLSFIGKDFGAGNGQKISVAVIVSTNSAGFYSGSNPNITVNLYGSNTSPATSTSGTLLGSKNFNDTSSKISIAIPSSDQATAYRYVWVQCSTGGGRLVELKFFKPGTAFARPRCVAFYAGRSFFAGVDGTNIGSNIYFSQVVIDKTKYGLCYQQNDPTSENFADLLATDGGIIKIPDVGKVQKLFPFQNSLMVFANNGVWLISGQGNNSFSATGYTVKRITNVGMTSPNSVVDVKGIPCWWAEDGLYTVVYDPNYDSTAVKSLTEESIKTFISAVPKRNIPYIKACFDLVKNYVYWLYNRTDGLSVEGLNSYNSLLVLNSKTGAFFPWYIDDTVSNTPKIRGFEYIQDGDRTGPYAVKLTTQYTRSGTTYITYSDFTDETNWKDWNQYSTAISSSTNLIDYSSYIIAGYRIDAQAMNNFQSKYVWTFMEDLTNSSLKLQGLWDFTNNSSSGKWSTPQQAYNSLTSHGRTYDDIRVSRRVVRGTGKALQVKYYSDTGKPFRLVGWGIFEAGNDSP